MGSFLPCHRKIRDDRIHPTKQPPPHLPLEAFSTASVLPLTPRASARWGDRRGRSSGGDCPHGRRLARVGYTAELADAEPGARRKPHRRVGVRGGAGAPPQSAGEPALPAAVNHLERRLRRVVDGADGRRLGPLPISPDGRSRAGGALDGAGTHAATARAVPRAGRGARGRKRHRIRLLRRGDAGDLDRAGPARPGTPARDRASGSCRC